MFDSSVIIALIEKTPSWFIMAGITLFAIHRVCLKHIKTINKLFLRDNVKKNNKLILISQQIHDLSDKIDKNRKDINILIENDKKQEQILQKLVKNKKK